MRRYPETRDTSSELLRLVIPMMRNHPAGFHPASYAIWYEYASGTNPPLKEAIDKLVSTGSVINDDVAYSLHEKYISGEDAARTARMRTHLEHMLRELTSHTGSAGAHAEAYSESLSRFGDHLRPGNDLVTLQEALDTMADNTLQMREKTGQLHAQLQGSAAEIETLRSELQRVKCEAMTDPLTGITNRRGFELALDEAGQGRDYQLAGCCLLIIDIDHFKKCNDTYGHLFGDKVIRGVAQAISRNVKGQDTAARIGGEEFAVLLPATPLDGAHVLAERIRSAIASGRVKNGSNGELIGNITISVGVAQAVAGETGDELCHAPTRRCMPPKVLVAIA